MTARRVEPGLMSLLEHVLAGQPRLPNAACRGRPEPFDAVVDSAPTNGKPPSRAHRAALEVAAGLCSRCLEAACPDRLTTDTTEQRSA